jgi:hypothetical protein
MTTDKHPEEQPLVPETTEFLTIEKRSDPQVIYDGMTAFGVMTGGLGTFGYGAAKFKDAFFGGNEQPQQPQSTPAPPSPREGD